MVDQCRHLLARTAPFVSSVDVAIKRCPRKVRPDRESDCALGYPRRLHLLARTAWLSAVHVSPRAFHVARNRSPAMAGCSRHGGAHGGWFVCRLRYLAGRAAASWSALKG